MSNEEIVEDFIKEIRDFELNKDIIEIVYALEAILEEQKQDKSRIKELEIKQKEMCEEYCPKIERIRELEEINKKYIVQLTDEQYRNLVDRIRKESKQEFEQKVIDKMEKLNKEIKNGDEIEAIFKIKQQQILEELLEGK